MKALVQRVRYARITIDAKEQREIGPGMLVLFGCAEGDELSLCDKLADKVANLRIFSDEAGKMHLSALDLGLSCMVVSQFTLLADTKKGNRPSFTAAARPPFATEAYERFLALMRTKGFKDVQSGEFGADMQIEFCNDGPVTIMMDTEEWKR